MKKTILISLLSSTLFAETAEEIAKKSYDIMSGYKSSFSKTTMILKNAQGVENRRELEISKLENNGGDKSLIRFIFPEDIKDTKLLSYEVIGGDDKQWLYLPALKRVKRISSRNKSGSFMASEFSYEDISSQNYKNYTYNGNAKNITENGAEYFKIERIPIDANSGYSKQIVFIDKKTYLAHHGEYFDKQNRLLKKIEFLEYQNIDNIYRIKKINITNIQNGKSTILSWDEDKINVDINKNKLSKRALK
jgi:outer membrane lipoprotein-sorting protein